MEWTLKTFTELNTAELYDLLKLRNEVFVVEQLCPYNDTDDKDQSSLHLFAYEGTTLAAYARLLPPGISYPESSIGRVVTAPAHRGKGLGRELMERSITSCMEHFRTSSICISAQSYLEAFYTSLGFASCGESYLEDNIPHIKMRLGK